MLESDLRRLFERQAAIRLHRPAINIPAARKIGRTRLLRRRATAIGSPVLAAGVVLGVVLAGPFSGSPRQRPSGLAPSPASTTAPTSFNPMFPYATAGYFPFQPSVIGQAQWRTAALVRATAAKSGASLAVVFYANGWCAQKSGSLTCGSTSAGTQADLKLGRPAPDVKGHAAYWASFTGGNLTPLKPGSGRSALVAYQYLTGGWAVAETTGTRTDVLKVARGTAYGSTSGNETIVPFQLTSLPSDWNAILYAASNGPAAGSAAAREYKLVVGTAADRPGTPLRNALVVVAATQPAPAPRCRSVSVGQGPVSGGSSTPSTGPTSSPSKPGPCPSTVINGVRVYPGSPKGEQVLTVPDDAGMFLSLTSVGPAASLTPSQVFADHLRLVRGGTLQPVSP